MSYDKTGTEGRRLFVGGLPFSADERDLEDLCEKYGKIEDAFIVKDKYSDVPKSRGFGFVTFKDIKDAEDCIEALNKTCWQDREITVQVARNSSRGGAGGGGRRGGGGGGRRDYRDGGYRGGSRSYGRYGSGGSGGSSSYRSGSYGSSSRGSDRSYNDRERRYDDREQRYDDREERY